MLPSTIELPVEAGPGWFNEKIVLWNTYWQSNNVIDPFVPQDKISKIAPNHDFSFHKVSG